MPPGVNQLYTDEDCVEALWRVARKIGRPPGKARYDIERLASDPAPSTLGKRLGDRTWEGTLAAAGLDDWDGPDDESGPPDEVPGA